MLQFLLDEHISPVIAREALRKAPGIKILSFQSWHAGAYLGVKDPIFLPEASKEGWTFVTYDQKTIRPLLKDWAERGVQHMGFVFIDDKTIAPHDFGGLVEALCFLWKSERRADWTNRVVFLTRPA